MLNNLLLGDSERVSAGTLESQKVKTDFVYAGWNQCRTISVKKGGAVIMNGNTQVVEKDKEKKEKVEKVKLDCSPVEILSFQEIVTSFVERCSNAGAKVELRKSIVRYALGFMKEGLFNNTMRVRSYPRAEVNALKESLNTACVMSVLECIYDMLVFNTSKEEAIKVGVVDLEDLDWTLGVVDLKSLELKNSVYTIPDDLDSNVLKLRIPGSKKIESPSRLADLIESFLVIQNYPSVNVDLRKLFAQYAMGQIPETAIAKKLFNRELPYRKIIFYINKNYKAIQEAIKSGKANDDASYITAVLKA